MHGVTSTHGCPKVLNARLVGKICSQLASLLRRVGTASAPRLRNSIYRMSREWRRAMLFSRRQLLALAATNGSSWSIVRLDRRTPSARHSV